MGQETRLKREVRGFQSGTGIWRVGSGGRGQKIGTRSLREVAYLAFLGASRPQVPEEKMTGEVAQLAEQEGCQTTKHLQTISSNNLIGLVESWRATWASQGDV